jgi:hypothetical protein
MIVLLKKKSLSPIAGSRVLWYKDSVGEAVSPAHVQGLLTQVSPSATTARGIEEICMLSFIEYFPSADYDYSILAEVCEELCIENDHELAESLEDVASSYAIKATVTPRKLKDSRWFNDGPYCDAFFDNIASYMNDEKITIDKIDPNRIDNKMQEVYRQGRFSNSDMPEELSGVWHSRLDNIILDYSVENETESAASERLGEPVIWGRF